MVKKEVLKNKKGETLVSKEGYELVEFKLESGDEFIPLFNTVMTKSKKITVKNKEQTIAEHKIKASVRDKEGKIILDENSKDKTGIFLTLTPSQAKTLTKKAKGYLDENGDKVEPIAINQHLFIAYEYETSGNNAGKYIGVGIKGDDSLAKTFEDFN